MKIVSVIPCRSGSLSVKNKNIRDIGEQPLIAYSIIDSLRVPEIEETYVSTDSEEIATIALKYGAEVPFLRPKEQFLSQQPGLLEPHQKIGQAYSSPPR